MSGNMIFHLQGIKIFSPTEHCKIPSFCVFNSHLSVNFLFFDSICSVLHSINCEMSSFCLCLQCFTII